MKPVTPSWLYPDSAIKNYGFAILSVAAALLLRKFLSPLLGDTNPYHTVWAAIFFSSWYCGLGPSILSALLSAVGVLYWFLPPAHSFTPQDPKVQVSGLIGFLFLSALIIALGEANRRSNTRSEREAADRLRSEQEFRVLANSMPELCWMANPDGYLFWYNERWYEYTGTVPEQMQGWGWQSVHDPDLLPEVMQRWTASIQAGTPFEMEFPLRGSDGSFQWFLTRIRPVYAHGKLVRWIGTNANVQRQRELQLALIEAHQRLESRVKQRTDELETARENLSQLSARLLQLQDEERRRLARELHDSAGQMLAAIKMNLSAVQSTPFEPGTSHLIAETLDLIDQVLREIRTTSHLLHPPLLDEVGLVSALQWFVQGFSERSKITVSLEVSPTISRLAPEAELAVFRIVQECLTNVHRHSGSSTASLRLAREEGGVVLEVRDSGTGIPQEKQRIIKSSGPVGVGLRGMRERVTQLGGWLTVQSDTTGTLIKASFPLDQLSVQTAVPPANRLKISASD